MPAEHVNVAHEAEKQNFVFYLINLNSHLGLVAALVGSAFLERKDMLL